MMLTATTTGIRKPSVTPNDCPRPAMMKANSPICAIEKPLIRASLRDEPESR